MGKELFQFVFSSSFDTLAKSAEESNRNHGKPAHGAHQPTLYERLRQCMDRFRFLAWAPAIRTVLLAGIIAISFPMHAPASDVTLVWDDNNPTVDGYKVFQRTEDQAYDYTRPVWPTDGRDHVQTSCTITDLTAGAKYYFVVRAYADRCQSADSNEVVFVAPAPSAGTIVNGNHAPEQPMITSFKDGLNDVTLTPLLSASEFDDPDPDAYHTGTEWRIYLAGNGQHIIFNRNCEKGRLLEIRVPHMVLEPSTRYSAQVRFFDDHGAPSPWSQPVVFLTNTDEHDRNGNNIPDSQEIRTSMDMNGDSISDLEQPWVVKSLFTYDEQHIVGISVESNDPTVRIQAAAGIAVETLTSTGMIEALSEDQMPYGLIGCRIKVDPSEIVTVKFNLSDPLPLSKTQWVRYDAELGISNCDASTDMDDSGTVVIRYLEDGGDDDADGVANGVIVDLSGPREAEANDASLALSDDGSVSAGGSSGGCFLQSLF